MEDQGIILRTTLGLKDAAHRRTVESVGTKTVDCLRGDTQKSAAAEDLRRLCDLLFAPSY